MNKETRRICFDETLQIEAYQLCGMIPDLPNHFHEHYAVGVIAAGNRRLRCKNREYLLEPGDIILLNPGESHACAAVDGDLDYRGFNIAPNVMERIRMEIAGTRDRVCFSRPVVRDEAAGGLIRRLHEMVCARSGEFEKEETLLIFLELVMELYTQPFAQDSAACRTEVGKACEWMEKHYAERVTLEDICAAAHLTKSTLLRAFTREMGITPYRFLENLRINRARAFLEQGDMPAEAAVKAGFSDQSHFSSFFTMFTGLTPGAYRNMFQETGVHQ